MTRGMFFLFSFVLCTALADLAVYENLSVIKTVELVNPIVKVTLRIAVRGSESIDSKYEVAIPNSEFEHLSYIEATTSKKVGLPVKMERIDEEYCFVCYLICRNGVAIYSIGSE